jgi:hypothetical protein
MGLECIDFQHFRGPVSALRPAERVEHLLADLK